MNLKDRLINSYTVSFLWFGYKFLKNRIPMRYYGTRGLDEKKVVFMSLNGKTYGDNPKAISEMLHARHPEYEIVWGMKDVERAKQIVPSYVRVVQYSSAQWYRELATAGTWVTNVLLPNGTRKRRGQRYLQTWHGDRGFKKILFDATQGMAQFHRRNYFRKIIEPEICDLMLSGSRFAEGIFHSAFHYEGAVLKQGTPRDDCLVNLTPERRAALREALGIAPDAHVLLYAPTYRDHLNSDVQTVGAPLACVLEALEKKTGEPWLCIQRGHFGCKLDIDSKLEGKFLDLTDYEDMADILCVSDLLITDYSSTAGDFALTGGGTFLYQDDFESYITDDRQLYFRMEDTPFWTARTPEELLQLVEAWTPERARKNAEEIMSFYGSYESGKASEAVVDYIVHGELKQ